MSTYTIDGYYKIHVKNNTTNINTYNSNTTDTTNININNCTLLQNIYKKNYGIDVSIPQYNKNNKINYSSNNPTGYPINYYNKLCYDNLCYNNIKN